MAGIDWGAIESEFDKSYVDDGIYQAKVVEVKVSEKGANKSIAQDFTIKLDKGLAPHIIHWLSFKNTNWRCWHNRNLMRVLGLSDEKAKEAVGACEAKGNKEDIVKAYTAVYEKLVAKQPTVEIEVWTRENGYKSADFNDPNVHMGKKEASGTANQNNANNLDDILGGNPQPSEPTPKNNLDDILNGAKEVQLNADELPPF